MTPVTSIRCSPVVICTQYYTSTTHDLISQTNLFIPRSLFCKRFSSILYSTYPLGHLFEDHKLSEPYTNTILSNRVLKKIVNEFLTSTLIISLGVPKRVKMCLLMNFITTLELLEGRATASTHLLT